MADHPIARPAHLRPMKRQALALASARTFAPAGTALAAVLALSALVIRDPHQGGSWAQCPTLALTGEYCPGCGSLRALHDLATGDVVEAIGHNLFAIVSLVWLGWAWLAWTVRESGGTLRPPPSGRLFCWGLLVGIAVFTIARNLPGSPLAP